MATKCPKCQADISEDSHFCSKCGMPIKPGEAASIALTKTIKKPTISQGETIAGKYKILAEIGRGGMGVVYKAQDIKLKRNVALKFLPSELMRDVEAKERFIREAQAAAALEHPNICAVFEVDESDDQTFIAMSYIQGQSLKQKLEHGPMDIKEAEDIIIQVAEGLGEAHDKGVVHRDIKPANIMLTEKGQAKITDFGLAKLTWDADLTKASTIMGTVAYMSPEQARGDKADQRSDIWSIGVLFYEMLTGRLPFRKTHEQALIYLILNEAPKPLSYHRPDTPKHIEQVVNKALEKDLNDRYQNISDLIKDLKKAVPIAIPEKKESIAVLPLVNMSADPEQEYFCDGMAEELINALTHIKDLRVVARTSAFSFKGKDLDIEEIGKKLRVNKILEGSVRKAGNKLRITAQLINVSDGFHLWSERYDREMKDIFAIQDEVTLAIIEKLKIELLGQEKARLLKRHTQDSEVYNWYLKGRYFWAKRTGEGLYKAIKYFEEAIKNDPGYALAYSGLADCYSVLAFYGFVSPREGFPKAKKATLKALEIDDSLAEAHASRGYYSMFYDWNWDTAEKSLRLAIELNPGFGIAHQYYAGYLGIMGRFDEALNEIEQALELDPLSIRMHTELGNYFCWSGRLGEGEKQLKKTLEMDPNYGLAHGHIGLCYTRQGRYEEAIAAINKAIKLIGRSPMFIGYLAVLYALAGSREKAEDILHEMLELSKQRYIPPVSIANVYAALGEMDHAFEWLEKAYIVHDAQLPLIKTRGEYEPLRSSPRIKEILKKIGLN